MVESPATNPTAAGGGILTGQLPISEIVRIRACEHNRDRSTDLLDASARSPMWPDHRDTQQLLDAAHAGDAAASEWLFGLAIARPCISWSPCGSIGASRPRRCQRRRARRCSSRPHRRLDDYLAARSAMPFHLWLRQIARDRMIDAHRRHRAPSGGASTANKPRRRRRSSPTVRPSTSRPNSATAANSPPPRPLLQRELETAVPRGAGAGRRRWIARSSSCGTSSSSPTATRPWRLASASRPPACATCRAVALRALLDETP